MRGAAWHYSGAMPNITADKVLAKATEIAELRRMLADKEAEFGRLIGRPGSASRVSGTNGGGESIAKQVLSALSAGPATRGELIAKLGHEAAVTSALKKHKERGSIDNATGKWALVPAAPTTTAVTPVQTRKARTGK